MSVGGINVINDFRKIRVNGFKRNIALQIVETSFKEEGWEYSPLLGNKILDCIGESYIPYFVAITLTEIFDPTFGRSTLNFDNFY